MAMPANSIYYGMTHAAAVNGGVPAEFNAAGVNHLKPMMDAFVSSSLLDRMLPHLVFEKFGQAFELPTRSTKSARFRRYLPLDNTPVQLEEGVTPAETPLDAETYECTLKQYGALVTISDVILDTHTDPILNEAIDLLAEQSAQMMERVRIDALLSAITAIYRPGATALVSNRNQVANKITRALQRQITQVFKKNNIPMINKIIRSTASFGTESVANGYVAICHPNLAHDVRSMPGFIDPKNYGTLSAWDNEIGSVEDVRYVYTTLMPIYTGQGADKGTSWTGTDAVATTKADVYPIIFLGKDAYGIVPLKGKSALAPFVVPATPSKSDPLGQRAHIGWKSYLTCIILNPYAIAKAEVCCSEIGVADPA